MDICHARKIKHLINNNNDLLHLNAPDSVTVNHYVQ